MLSLEDIYAKAARLIDQADGFIIGAGMGIDSELPDFGDPGGFWKVRARGQLEFSIAVIRYAYLNGRCREASRSGVRPKETVAVFGSKPALQRKRAVTHFTFLLLFGQLLTFILTTTLPSVWPA